MTEKGSKTFPMMDVLESLSKKLEDERDLYKNALVSDVIQKEMSKRFRIKKLFKEINIRGYDIGRTFAKERGARAHSISAVEEGAEIPMDFTPYGYFTVVPYRVRIVERIDKSIVDGKRLRVFEGQLRRLSRRLVYEIESDCYGVLEHFNSSTGRRVSSPLEEKGISININLSSLHRYLVKKGELEVLVIPNMREANIDICATLICAPVVIARDNLTEYIPPTRDATPTTEPNVTGARILSSSSLRRPTVGERLRVIGK
mgnify:CR=1 FL=1